MNKSSIVAYDKREQYLLEDANHFKKCALHYEDETVRNARLAAYHWIKWYLRAESLFSARVHKERGMTWAQYCKEVLAVSDSFFKAMRMTTPYALAVYRHTGLLPTYSQLQQIPKHLRSADDQFIAAVYQGAMQLCQDLSGSTIPKSSHYEAAHEEIVEEINNRANGREDSIHNEVDVRETRLRSNIINNFYERGERQIEHIKSKSRFITQNSYTYNGLGLRKRLRNEACRLRRRRRVDVPSPTAHMLLLVREEK